MYFGVIETYVMQAVCGIIVITLHGFLTAFVSWRLGDDTPKREGMVTLNPLKHFEPLGFIVYVFFGYGWGQPVRTSAFGYKDRKKGCVLTALLPIAAEVVLGFCLIFAFRINDSFLHLTALGKPAQTAVYFIYDLGIAFAGFGLYNLIPVYPLNGHKLLLGVLPPNKVMKYNEMEKILQLVLVFLIFMGVVSKVIGLVCYLPIRLILGW